MALRPAITPMSAEARSTPLLSDRLENRIDSQAARRPIFFVHIEKTGGTSLREAALAHFPANRVVTLYGKHSRNTSQPAADIFAQRGVTRDEKLARLSDYLSVTHVQFFASHISDFWKLGCFDPQNAVTILRSPAERILSNYFFDRRVGRLKATSFAGYFRDPRNQNVQSERFRAVPLSALRLVGITEEYEAFVRAFNDAFGLQFTVRHEKRGSLPYRVRANLMLRRYRREIEALNQEDGERYAEAKELWAKTKAGF